LYLHENNAAKSQLSELTNELVKLGNKSNLKVTKVDSGIKGLPPASLQSFVQQQKDFPAMILTNHEKEFVNK